MARQLAGREKKEKGQERRARRESNRHIHQGAVYVVLGITGFFLFIFFLLMWIASR